MTPQQLTPYESEVLAALSVVGTGGSLTKLLAAAHGAPPGLVQDLVGRMGLRLPSSVTRGTPYPTSPELHPLLYEWYFTRETATFVSEVARGSGASWVFLGVPSVAHEMSKVSSGVRLIDANPAIVERFEGMAERATVTIGEIGDVPASDAGADRSEVAVIDPPWYPADVLRWIEIASRHITPGGAIVSTLFPALTRPSAAKERDAIFATAQRLGRVEFRQTCLQYSTPRFEVESLRASGVGDPGDWRRADLMVIRDTKPSPQAKRGAGESWRASAGLHLGLAGWSRYVLGEQVVMLADAPRTAVSSDLDSALKPIYGCPDNVLPSVSERDPLRQQVGLWTSRNRVASVIDAAVVRSWLRTLLANADNMSAVTDAPKWRDDPGRRLLLELLGLR